jgi:hypothetical protein
LVNRHLLLLNRQKKMAAPVVVWYFDQNDVVQQQQQWMHHTLHVLDHWLELLEVGMLPLVFGLVQPPDVLIPPFSTRSINTYVLLKRTMWPWGK